jgi:hypothetical protein
MYIISYLQKVVSVYVGYYQVCYFVLTEGCKCICRILAGTLFRTYEGSKCICRILSGIYFVLTEGSKCICRILSGTLFRTHRG